MITTGADNPAILPQTESVNATVAAVGPVGVSLPATKSPKSELSWQQVATAVAAAAGGAAWVSAVGSGVVALRLERAHLPVEPVVALMSVEHRFALGAGLLIAPLLAALIAFLMDWAAAGATDPVLRALRRWPRFQRYVAAHFRQVLAAATLVLGAALVYVLLRPTRETFLAEWLAVAIALPAAFHFLPKTNVAPHSFRERLVVFTVVLGAAGSGAIVAEAVLRTPSFDAARVTLRGQVEPITGGYITSTEHSVVLTPGCEVMQAVPRDLIAEITVGPREWRAEQC